LSIFLGTSVALSFVPTAFGFVFPCQHLCLAS
jgi:hypothetical protein